MKSICNIICASDDNYAMPLTVMLKSLEIHASSSVNIYILDGGISEKSKERIEKSLINKVNFIDLRDVEFNFKHKIDISKATYYRILIPSIFDSSFEKVLYLDCDMLILVDIYKLWNLELDANSIAAVPEMDKDAHFVSSKLGLPAYKILGIPSDNLYFNAGVLLINAAKWRKSGLSSQILNYLKNYQEYVLWHDQDGLNAILWNDWIKLDYRWNVMNRFFEIADINSSIFEKETFLEIKNQPYIIHFNQLPKPWERSCIHPYKDIFKEYFLLTEWKKI